MKAHSCLHKIPPSILILSQINSFRAPSNVLKIILILSSHLFLGLRVAHFFKDSRPKACMHLFSPSYVLHILHTSIFLVWSHEKLCYGVQIMKLFIMQFCPVSYSHRHLIPQIPSSMPLSYSGFWCYSFKNISLFFDCLILAVLITPYSHRNIKS
jgi:hypothetical protein